VVEFVTGNLLEADVDALVNTVNTKGVMGKGIALQFRRAFPENYEAYRAACDAGEVRLGRMFVFLTGRLERPRVIINFPTKGHWKSRSRLTDVEAGLHDLRRVLVEYGVDSVALPPLGCGLGGLRWAEVRPPDRAGAHGPSAACARLRVVWCPRA
jgi:O-acetyl-ADP-ribose deacetylase (regulator of RNase III)